MCLVEWYDHVCQFHFLGRHYITGLLKQMLEKGVLMVDLLLDWWSLMVDLLLDWWSLMVDFLLD